MNILKNKLSLYIVMTGSVNRGVILYFIMGFKEKFMVKKDGEMWIGKTMKHWQSLTRLSYKAVSNVINDLENLDLIITKVCLHPHNGKKMRMIRINEPVLLSRQDGIAEEYASESNDKNMPNGNGNTRLNNTNENTNENSYKNDNESNIYTPSKLSHLKDNKEGIDDLTLYNQVWRNSYKNLGLGSAEELDFQQVKHLKQLKGPSRTIENLKRQLFLIMEEWEDFLNYAIEASGWKQPPKEPNPKFLYMLRQQFWSYCKFKENKTENSSFGVSAASVIAKVEAEKKG